MSVFIGFQKNFGFGLLLTISTTYLRSVKIRKVRWPPTPSLSDHSILHNIYPCKIQKVKIYVYFSPWEIFLESYRRCCRQKHSRTAPVPFHLYKLYLTCAVYSSYSCTFISPTPTILYCIIYTAVRFLANFKKKLLIIYKKKPSVCSGSPVYSFIWVNYENWTWLLEHTVPNAIFLSLGVKPLNQFRAGS